MFAPEPLLLPFAAVTPPTSVDTLLPPLSAAERGKIYVDVPHRYFATPRALLDYLGGSAAMGANVALLLPHFAPSFSEYVVKDYEQPAPLFGTWTAFADTMREIAAMGLDRMIDVPFNHADWQAAHLRREWYKNHANQGIEAGADDTDADGRRVRINWGAFELDNGNRDLVQYWLDKILYPHCEKYHVNAVRIDAAWGLDPIGLATIVGETRKRFPQVWFVCENLGMAPLLKLAKSGLQAGSERFFNNFYWFEGGRYIPSDIYQLWHGSQGKPTCTLWSSHDVLMPAMRAWSRLHPDRLARLNDKALVRQVCEWDGLRSPQQLAAGDRAKVDRLMQLDYLLAATVSTDVMWVAGSERMLLDRVDVCRSGPGDFAVGLDTETARFVGRFNAMRARVPLLNAEGLLMPFGSWRRGEVGLRGLVKKDAAGRVLQAAVNYDLVRPARFPVNARLRAAEAVVAVTAAALVPGRGADLPAELEIGPGQGVVLACLPHAPAPKRAAAHR